MFWSRIFSAVWTLATFDRDTEFEGNGRQSGQFASSKNSHFQTEAKCKTFLAIMSFICMRIKLLFHINGFALSFALKQRFGLLLWLRISVSRNCSTVGCQKSVPFILQLVSAPLNSFKHQLKSAIIWVPFSFQAKIDPFFGFFQKKQQQWASPFYRCFGLRTRKLLIWSSVIYIWMTRNYAKIRK